MKKHLKSQYKMLSMLGKAIGLDISCRLSPQETICMKYQSLFSGKNKKNINLSSAEFAKNGKVISIISS